MKRMKQAPEDLNVIRNVTPTTGGAICGHQLCVKRKWSQKYQILTLKRAISAVNSAGSPLNLLREEQRIHTSLRGSGSELKIRHSTAQS